MLASFPCIYFKRSQVLQQGDPHAMPELRSPFTPSMGTDFQEYLLEKFEKHQVQLTMTCTPLCDTFLQEGSCDETCWVIDRLHAHGEKCEVGVAVLQKCDAF